MIGGNSATPPRVIVVGNEKGGTGKSTSLIHITIALVCGGHKVACLDLDTRQATLGNFLENRQALMKRKGLDLPMPYFHKIDVETTLPESAQLSGESEAIYSTIWTIVTDLLSQNDFVVIDTPGTYSKLNIAGHACADLLLTPVNNSFVDLDVLAKIDSENHNIKRPSNYGELVFSARMLKAEKLKKTSSFKWFVMRNRTGYLSSHNQKSIQTTLEMLANRIGFQPVLGFSEREIFRELFLDGLTILDLKKDGVGKRINLSHIAARQELLSLMQGLGLPFHQD